MQEDLSRDTVDCQTNIPISIYLNLALNDKHHCEVLLKKKHKIYSLFPSGSNLRLLFWVEF